MGDNWTPSKPNYPELTDNEDLPHEEQGVEPEEDALPPGQAIITPPQDLQEVNELGKDHQDKIENLGTELEPQKEEVDGMEVKVEVEVEVVEVEMEVDYDHHIPRCSRKRKRNKGHMSIKLREVKVEHDKEMYKFQEISQYENMFSETVSKLSRIEINTQYDRGISETVSQLEKLKIGTQTDSLINETVTQLSRLEINTQYDNDYELCQTIRQLAELEIETQSDGSQDNIYNRQEK